MRKNWLLVGVVLAGCGVSTVEMSGDEADERGSLQHSLNVRLTEQFGEGARIQRIFGKGEELLLGVTTESEVVESDVRLPLGLARYQPAKGTLQVVESEQRFVEGLRLGDATALIGDDGALTLKDATGKVTLLSSVAQSDLIATPKNDRLVFTEAVDNEGPGDTAIAITDLAGVRRILADGDGVDDRPAISPDGKTVVFVSGRTGIASLWRTTLEGEAPVQLTNLGLESLVRAEDDESDPAGFVPPPVAHDRIEWVDADHLRYDSGGGAFWQVDVRSGVAQKEVAR